MSRLDEHDAPDESVWVSPEWLVQVRDFVTAVRALGSELDALVPAAGPNATTATSSQAERGVA